MTGIFFVGGLTVLTGFALPLYCAVSSVVIYPDAEIRPALQVTVGMNNRFDEFPTLGGRASISASRLETT